MLSEREVEMSPQIIYANAERRPAQQANLLSNTIMALSEEARLSASGDAVNAVGVILNLHL